MFKHLTSYAFLVAISFNAQSAIMQSCIEQMQPIENNKLEIILANQVEKNAELSVDNQLAACENMKLTKANITGVLRKDYLINNQLTGYEYAKFIIGDYLGFFTIEQFEFKDKKILEKISDGLSKKEIKTLGVKSHLAYDFFIENDRLILMQSNISHAENNFQLLQTIRASLMTTNRE